MKKIIFILTLLLSFNGFAQFPIPGIEGFEATSGPTALPSTTWALGTGNWAVFDNGVGLGQRWGINNGTATPPLVYAGSNAAYINRENIGNGNTSEDYLATPLVHIPANGQLHFYTRSFTNLNQGMMYQIKVAPSTATQNDYTAYTNLVQEWNEDQLTAVFNVYEEKVVNFPASMYNTDVYVAFVMKWTQPAVTPFVGERWLVDKVTIAEQCLDPTTPTATGLLYNQATLSWGNPGGASSWEVEVIPSTGTPTGTGVVYNGTLPYIATGLTANTCYKYYVRSLCSTGLTSNWVGPTNFCTTTAPPVCGGNFVDSGGSSGVYQNNENITTVICPTNSTDLVTVTFTSFATESCCDHLSIYDGTSVSAPLLGTYQGTTLPPALTSSTPGGCLTFVFTSDSSVTATGWVANVTCAPAPTCPKPTSLVASATTANSTTLSFINNSSATNFEYIALPCGSPAPTNGATGTSGIAANTNPIVITGLTPATCYTLYVRAICAGNDNSNWSTGININTLLVPPACGGTFFDPGGLSNYANNITAATGTTVICPTNPTDLVTVTFTSFSTEGCCDFLSVYNGNSSTAPLLGMFAGSVSPGVITSSTPGGCLTFVFTTDGSVTSSGWVANVTCAPAPTCTKPTALSATVLSTTAVLSWTQSPNPNASVANNWQVIALPCGSPAPTAASTGWVAAPTNPFTITGLSPTTCYNFYVRAVCSASDSSAWSALATGTTQALPPVCGGNFVDSGGSAGNYQDGENITTTICPQNATDLVTVNFTSFSTESCCDHLSVYDGNSTSAPLLGIFQGTTLPPELVSSAPGGCLTFVFTSDSSVISSGWVANISCGPAPTCPKPTALSFSATTSNSTTLSFTNNSTATNFEYLAVPCGSPVPTNGATGTSGIAAGTNPILITGLVANTCYTIYVRAVCTGNDFSNWSVGANITTQLAPPECGGNFFDPGLLSNYPDNSNIATLICPSNTGDKVTITFTSFNTEENFDTLSVYNGNSTSSPLIGTFSGNSIPDSITSSAANGCLYFVFVSNDSNNNSGWSSNITCAPPVSCPKPLGFTSTPVVTDSTQLSWIEAGSATSWQILVQPCGTPNPTASSTGWFTATSSPFTITGLTPGCCNEYFVRSVCDGSSTSAWTKVNNSEDGSYIVWADGPLNTLVGTYPGGTVTAAFTGPGNTPTINTNAFSLNLDTTGANTFQTFGPTSNPPSQDLTFTFSTPVIISRYTMADIDLGAFGWNDTFNFAGVTFTSTTSTNLITTTTGAVAITDVDGNAEFGNWYMSTTPVSSFSLHYSVTNGLTHAYLAYAMKVFIPCPPLTPPSLAVSVNSPTQCQGTTATVTATPNTSGTYSYVWTVPAGVTNPGNVATFTTTIAGNYSVIITDTTTNVVANGSGAVTFNPIITPTFTNIPSICQNGIAPLLPATSTNGISGTWNPAIINTAVSGTTTYTFTPNTTLAGQECAVTTTLNITITAPITPTFTQVLPVCTGTTMSALPTTSTNGVTGTWSPALNNTTTTTYTFTPATGQCALPTTMQIQVNSCNLDIYASAVWMQDCTTTGDGKFFNTTGAGADLINPDGSNFAINYGVHVQNSSTLLLRGAEIKTFKSSSSNVCNARMNYRVFPTSTIPGAFTPWDLPFYSDCNTTTGVFNAGGGPCIAGQQKWQCVSQAGCTPPLDLTTLAPGTYTIQVYYDINGSFTTTTGCSDNLVLDNGGNYYVANFTIQAPATVSGTNPTTCMGNNGTITISNLASNATYSVTFSDDAVVTTPANYTSDATGTIVISGLNSGTYTNFSMTINNCTTNLSNLVVLTDPALPSVSVNNASICSTGSATITATPISTGTYSYSWTVPSTASNPGNVNSFTTQVGGTYSVLITDTTTNCSSATASGIVTILPDVTMTLTSANNDQTVCIDTPISSIIFSTTNGVTNVTATGLPTGVTGTFGSGTYTLTGTPSVAGNYPYTVTTSGGCGSVTQNGTITVSPNVTLNLTTGNNNQSVCINTAISSIDYSAGNGATNVTATGLPLGVTGVYNAGVYSITGTPSVAGNYPYTVTTSGGCSSVTLAGTIVVNALTVPTFGFGTATTICQNGAVETLSGTSSNGFSGTWNPTVVDNTASGVYTFTPNTGQCASTTTYTVTVQNAFDFEFDAGCDGENFTIHANPIANGYDQDTASYVWLYNTNVVSTAESFNVTAYLLSTAVNESLPITFSLTITRADGCSTTKSIEVTKVYCEIQKGISPNNDLLNDFFDLELLNVDKLEIYNRYGMKVYSKVNYMNEWKGQSDKGDELPDGTYYYVIQFKNDQSTKTGWIYINREH